MEVMAFRISDFLLRIEEATNLTNSVNSQLAIILLGWKT